MPRYAGHEVVSSRATFPLLRGVDLTSRIPAVDVIEILVVKKAFGDVDQAFETLVSSRLARCTDPVQISRLLKHV